MQQGFLKKQNILLILNTLLKKIKIMKKKTSTPKHIQSYAKSVGSVPRILATQNNSTLYFLNSTLSSN